MNQILFKLITVLITVPLLFTIAINRNLQNHKTESTYEVQDFFALNKAIANATFIHRVSKESVFACWLYNR